MQRAYDDVAAYNAEASHPIKVRCLCWFVDATARGWDEYALSNPDGGLRDARRDLARVRLPG
jgi:hypothetical protein